MIKTHYFLLHVDLSHCKMNIEETMYIGLCVKSSNQLMSLHLTGNTCHVYGRAFVRTLIGCEPQQPIKIKQDMDNYISEIDTTVLMVFSNFYKQRMMPDEIYQFFVNNKTEVCDIDVNANFDYIKVIEKQLEIAQINDGDKPKIHFEEEKLEEDDLKKNKLLYPAVNPLIRIYQDYTTAFIQ